MSYFAKEKRVRLRLCFDPKERFPEKLYDVANDNFLVKWGDTGESVVVEPELFTEHVLICYPGFLQISTFANLRRLFREYGFSWKMNDDATFEFSHESFVRNQRHLLDDIYTRRKSFYRQASHLDLLSNSGTLPKERKRRSLRRRTLLFQPANDDGDAYIRPPVDEVAHSHVSDSHHFGQQPQQYEVVDVESYLKPKLDPSVLDIYIRNELTEEEILRLMERHDGILGHLNNSTEDGTPAPEIKSEYMYRTFDNTDMDTVYDTYEGGSGNVQYSGYVNMDSSYDDETELHELKTMANMYDCYPNCQCRCHQM